MTGRAWSRRIVMASGLLVAVAGAATLLMRPAFNQQITTAGGTGASVAWWLLGVAATLVIAAAVGWIARPGSTLALVAVWAAATWLAPELVGSGRVLREARSLGFLIAPLFVPLIVHLPLRALRADRGLVGAAVLVAYLGFGAAAVVRSVTWDPFLVLDCAPACSRGDNVLRFLPDITLSLAVGTAIWWGTIVIGVGLATWSAVALIRDRRRGRLERLVVVSALGVGCALVVAGAVRVAASRLGATESAAVGTMVGLGLAAGVMAGAVALLRSQEGLRAANLRRLVELLDATAESGSLRGTLAILLADPGVRVVYALPGAAGTVDELGRPAPPAAVTATRAVTPIERSGTLIALVEHDRDLDPELLAREIGSAASLAVDNERLGALARAHVRALQASRASLVEAGDAARRRLERDLHDGAQQRLLAVSYELRLAQAATPGAPDAIGLALDQAVAGVDASLTELRELAHGIWPAVLAEAGLQAALESLADESPVPMTLDGLTDERLPAPVEAAAYLAVTESLRRAVAGVATGIAVRARRASDALHLEVRVAGLRPEARWIRVEDRVGAAGGEARVTADAETGTLLAVELPCA